MRFHCLLLVTLAFAWTLAAEEPAVKQDWSAVPAIKLMLRPADEPSPALKYRLLPSVAELVPGNAALAYGRANAADWTRWLYARPEVVEREAELAKLRLKELPDRKEWEVFAQLMPEARLREVRRAANSEQCDWDLLARVREEGMAVNLIDLQGLRPMSQALCFKAREQLARGQVADALEVIKLQFALARHTAQAPTLNFALTGSGIAQQAIQILEDCLEQPHCPNLYWAFVELPRPLICWRRAIQGDAYLFDANLDSLADLERRVYTPDQFATFFDEFMERLRQRHMLRDSELAQYRLTAATVVASDYRNAKDALLKQGRPRADVEQMAMGQVVYLRLIQRRREYVDHLLKWSNLPYREAEAGMEALGSPSTDMYLLARFDYLWPPAALGFLAARENLERRLAALRCIEAIRMHAAKAGQLPDQLSDIKCVPVPADPVLSRPFDYARTANGFTLRAEPFTRVAREQMAKTGKIAANVALNYDITFTR